MTTTTARGDRDRADLPGAGHDGLGRGTAGGFAGAVASEWTKLWSVRTPYLCLVAGLVMTGVFTFYYASIARINEYPVQPVGNAAASSAVLVQFAVVVLAMVTVASEYSTGSVRASLLWVPRRHLVQAAKALVAGAVAFVAGTACAVMGMAVAWGPFGGRASFEAGTAVGQVLAVGLYQALVAVLTVGVAFATASSRGRAVDPGDPAVGAAERAPRAWWPDSRGGQRRSAAWSGRPLHARRNRRPARARDGGPDRGGVGNWRSAGRSVRVAPP
ncbi:ABC transporter permease [Streptomyces narbonensis]|uniref:ABC transporter permease n=1 Tax=Streptomyces narbonensis TaxID=67333 RepID=A0ABV3CK10_9ACTN